jgi:hypothetical protein
LEGWCYCKKSWSIKVEKAEFDGWDWSGLYSIEGLKLLTSEYV